MGYATIYKFSKNGVLNSVSPPRTLGMDSTDWAFYAVSIVTATVVSIVVFRIFAILSSARAINEKNVLERKHTSKSKGDGGQPIRVAIIGAGK